MNKIITELILILCRLKYRKYGREIFYIKGIGKDEGEYLLYTRSKETAERMNRF